MTQTLRFRPRVRTLTCALLISLASTATYAQMYRYIDDEGKPVITNSLPQEVVARGYQILNNQGRVIEEVPPAPTEEEIAERERQAAEEEQRKIQAEQQREQDRQLLRQYSTPDDTVRALQRSLREMFSLIRLKQGNITNLEGQLVEEESRAANLERSGRDVPDSIYDSMNRIKSQRADLRREIRDQLEEIESLRGRYRERVERMEAITGQQRTLPLTIPEEEDFSAEEFVDDNNNNESDSDA